MSFSTPLALKDLAHICRACLIKGPAVDFVSLSEEPARGTFMKSTHVYIGKDLSPLRLCRSCLRKCSNWLRFRTMVENNEKLFQSIIAENFPSSADPLGEKMDDLEDEEEEDDDDEEEEDEIEREDVEEEDSEDIQDGDWNLMFPTVELPEEVVRNADILGGSPHEPEDMIEDTTPPNINRRGQDPVILCPVEGCVAEIVGFKKFESHCLKTHVDKGRIACPICDLRYERVENLRNHFYVHTNEKFECPECDKLFHRPKTLKDHLRDAHLKYIRKDTEGRRLNEELMVMEPVAAGPASSPHVTVDDDAKGTSSGFSDAFLDSLKQTEVTCPVCQATLSSYKMFEEHIGMHLSRVRRSCPLCAKQFKRIETLRCHMYVHTNILFSCSNCPRTFVNPKTYTDHMRDLHWTELEVKADGKTSGQSCAFCGKYFAQMGVLREHLKLHATAKKYPCPSCDMTFRLKITLKSHIAQRHKDLTRTSTAVCTFCNITLDTQRELMRHMLMTHSNESDLLCTTCGMLFKSRHGLTLHAQRKHSLMKAMHVCDECGRTFDQMSKLKDHQKVHSEETLYQCEICDKNFKRERALKGHMMNVHKIRIE